MSLAQARAVSSLFDGERLAVARQLQKHSRASLATEVGVSSAAVGQWESGGARPRPELVLKLSEQLELPVDYFAAGATSLRPVPEGQSFFRSLRKSTKLERESAMANAVLIAELVDVLERHAQLPELTVPEWPVDLEAEGEEIDALAGRLREEWELDDEPIGDVVREMERHGIVVVRLELAEQKAIDAFSWPGRDDVRHPRPIVILGLDKGDRARSRFDAAHELGHLVMHRDHPQPGDRLLEAQANRFASAFLFPPERFHREWPAGRLRWQSLIAVKRRWHVSLAALLYRAKQDELISQTAYESAVKYMSRAGWRKGEPGDLGPSERPKLLRQTLSMLDEHGVPLEQVAEEARLPAERVRLYAEAPGAAGRIRVEL